MQIWPTQAYMCKNGKASHRATYLTLDLPLSFMFVVLCLVFMSGITTCASFLFEQINQAIFEVFMLKQVFGEGLIF